MRKLRIPLSAALAFGITASSPPAASAFPGPNTTDGDTSLAFSLDEMNCFSSDIRARAVTPGTEPTGRPGTEVAAESDGGTNGIPCNRRDPKAPPYRRSQG